MVEVMTIVNVTAEDIENGVPGSAKSCPIALAARRIEGLKVTGITTRRAIFQGHGVTMLPLEAVQFIHSFDADCPVEPFSFEIEIPWDGLR
jgi:hypothetical protein